MSTKNCLNKRWFYLISGVLAMLFSGVLYAWSILKIPFAEDFGWSASTLSLNFTLTMCFFCLGAFFGSLICKKIGPKLTLLIAGALVGVGFVTTGLLNANLPYLLYVTYALLAGTGIGISYNVVVSTVCRFYHNDVLVNVTDEIYEVCTEVEVIEIGSNVPHIVRSNTQTFVLCQIAGKRQVFIGKVRSIVCFF